MKKAILWSVIVAAVSSVPVSGQTRVDTSRPLDANTRVGSGGINDTVDRSQIRVTGNDIVTGNVTGGREFRGNVPYSDPRAFRGSTSGRGVDRFVSDSAGAPGYGPDPRTSQSFYGASRGVAAPQGYTQQGYTGTYTPASVTTQREGTDYRVGLVDGETNTTIRQQDLVVPGLNALTSQRELYTASPLYGVQSLDARSPEEQAFLQRIVSGQVGNNARLSDAEIERMRQEINNSSEQPTDESGAPSAQPGETPGSTAIPSGQIPSASALQNPVGTSTVQTGQGYQSRFVVPGPEKQSTQYAELQKRLERVQKGPSVAGADQSSRDFNRELQRRTDAQRAAAQNRDASQATGEAGAQAPQFAGQAPAANEATAVDPLKVDSLATGVKAKEWGDYFAKAEEHMRAGKFTSALDQYEMAEQVSPGNSLVLLGKANAELGAGYYNRAEVNLRRAFMGDQALLMGQYNLRSFFGEERLAAIIKDLKEITNTEKDQSRPAFLLAYIAYNTGQERRAAGYLELAEKRAIPGDRLFPLIREHWKLPSGADVETDQDLNK